VTTKFDFLTRGFAAIGEPNVAVCRLPGTEVAFESEVERDHPFGRLLPSMQFGKLGHKVARFRQVNMDRPNAHHDALELPNGQIVLLTRLCEGQRARPLGSRAKRKGKFTPLPSPEPSRSPPSDLRDGSGCRWRRLSAGDKIDVSPSRPGQALCVESLKP
jgi:hypothetical protein